MKKILIIGANSFMAMHLIPELKEFEVYATSFSSLNKVKGVKYFDVDITNAEDFKKLPKVDIVINFAAYIGEDYDKCLDVNVLGIINILAFCKEKQVKKLIHSSSASIYEVSDKPIKENHTKKPSSNYSHSKFVSEGLIKEFSKENKMDYIIFRYASPFGPGQTVNSVLPIFIQKAMKNEEITIFDGGKREQEFIYVKDIVSAVKLAIESNESGCFNIGSGMIVNMKELAEEIISIFSSSSKLIDKKVEDSGICIQLDSSKAKNKLGFEAKYNLRKGLIDYKNALLS